MKIFLFHGDILCVCKLFGHDTSVWNNIPFPRDRRVYCLGYRNPGSVEHIGYDSSGIFLKAGIIKPRHVERLSNFLVHNLGFFFVPAGVGLMNCLGLIADEWLPIVGAAVGSTVVIIAVTGWTHRFVRKTMGHRAAGKNKKGITEAEEIEV